ncbi:hypothetical protein [Solimonas marina]|uniref:Uncharacterized protein n=1 Tax=Solimonas marina TaxID=2714601 RepID=A0A969WDH3_9GAMM|nr:hypothetical protein [Solimonas marina]NKF24539.1 hypothetical protein [Solimonas marina]
MGFPRIDNTIALRSLSAADVDTTRRALMIMIDNLAQDAGAKVSRERGGGSR